MLLSGGVDSSVALALLKEAGHDVTAFYLKIWLEDELSHLGDCAWEEDIEFAEATAKKLNIPFEILSLQREYYETVVAGVLKEIKTGHTPNPDIWCNEKIKFGSFYEKIPDEFEKVATGHYAQVEEWRMENGESRSAASARDRWRIIRPALIPPSTCHTPHSTFHIPYSESDILNFQFSILNFLKVSPDPIKDQTYFLSRLTQSQLKRAMFPIGHLMKTEVRELAEKYNLPSRNRPDSQGICFLGKFKFSDFLREHLGEKKGDIIEQETGKKLGTHSGFWFFTLGQRQGLNLSGGPWFVVKKAPETNEVFVSQSLPVESGSRSFSITDCNYIPSLPESGRYNFKIRHGEKYHPGILEFSGENKAKITLDTPDLGIAPGQSAVIYKDEYCLGGGVVSVMSESPKRQNRNRRETN